MIARLRGRRVFYGWWMVAAAAGIQFLGGGLLMQSFGAYVAVLRENFGWSKTALSGAFSVQQLAQSVFAPFQGPIVDRRGSRPMIRIGIVILACGFFFLSQVNSILMFYVACLILAMGFSFSAFFPLTVALVNWFDRGRARALSLMSLGFGVGGLAVPIIAYSLENWGWRETAIASGVITLVVGLPLAQVIRRRPEDYGEVVDGIREPEPDASPVSADASPSRMGRRDFTLREAMHTPAFWLISGGHGSALLVVSAVNVHAISHMKEDLGYSIASASLVITLMTATQVVGLLAGASIGDKYDQRLLAVGAMLMHMTGLLLLAYAVSLSMLVGFALFHGFAWGFRGPMMQAIRADYFGRTNYGAIMGISSVLIMVGQFSGPLIAGVLADSTGNYKLGFTVIALMAGMGSLFFVFAKRPAHPDHPTLLDVEALATEV
jgi:MFS family permease